MLESGNLNSGNCLSQQECNKQQKYICNECPIEGGTFINQCLSKCPVGYYLSNNNGV